MSAALLDADFPAARRVDMAELLSPTYDPHPVLQFDDGGRVLWANQAARELALAHGMASAAEIFPPWNGARPSAAPGQIEGRVGERLFRWALVREPHSSAVYAYGVEVTDLARCERQLRHAQRLELMGELSASIAHDFNNYLTGIAGELELALHRETSPDERSEFIQHAVHTCGHAARMVRTLLDFAQARELRLETIDADATIASALPLLRHLVGKKVALEHRPAPVPLLIEADPVALEQILGNLAANARDAMPEGGRFCITTRLVPFATDELPPRSNVSVGSFVEVKVTDTGCGMDAATAARAFEPFFTTKGPGRGTGLGLACVRELVEKHRGWIALDSQPGAGTAFRLHLPVSMPR